MTDEQKVREAFEAWAYEQTFDLERFIKNGAYNNQFTQEAWAGWQAAVAWMSGGEAVAWQRRWRLLPQLPTVEQKWSDWEPCTREEFIARTKVRIGFGHFPKVEYRELYTALPRAAEDARDAARYRELFNGPYPFCFDGETYNTKIEADQAIDQALAAKRGGE